MGKVVWTVGTEDKKCLLRTRSDKYYILTLTEEEYSNEGEHYRIAKLSNPDYDLHTLDIELSEKVKRLYEVDSDKYSEDNMPALKIMKGFKGTQEEIRKYIQTMHQPAKTKQESLVLDDSLYLIMTEDKKCIVRGRKNTKFVLATLDEHCNYKVLTCRQHKIIVDGMNNSHRHSWVYLTDNVKELYGVDSGIYDSEKLPKLIAVKAQTQYKIQL